MISSILRVYPHCQEYIHLIYLGNQICQDGSVKTGRAKVVGRFANRQQKRELRGLSHNWGPAVMGRVWDRDKGICTYCGGDAQEIDHVVPASLGGPTISANGVLACHRCNMRKGAGLALEVLTIAFAHLLRSGENIDWVEHLWEETQMGVFRAISDSRSELKNWSDEWGPKHLKNDTWEENA